MPKGGVIIESYLNVTVRVAKAEAEAAIASLRGQLASLQSAMASSGAMGGVESSASSVDRFTGSLRSAGYALSATFTAPLLLAGGSLLKFQLANETAMADLRKVYGANPLKDYSADISALGKNFEALSNQFGVNQTEVIGIGAAWAQAGVQGSALALSVQNTLKAMVIGDLSSTDATTQLISIQGQYRASSADLTKILQALNVVENSTAITMEGLITGFQRAAGAAAQGGVSYRELAAMLASIVPYAGTASQAGNSLKTIISNLEAPSHAAAQALALIGINIADTGWKSATATDKLREVAKAFEGLSEAQKNVIARQLSGAFQVSRFDILLNDVALSLDKATAGQSRFGKALAATSSVTVNAEVAQRELNIALDSNPKKLAIIGDTMKNKLADVLVKLMPLILDIADAILKLATWFSNLNPNVQKFVGYLLVALAALGPFLLYMSALKDVIKYGGDALSLFLTPLKLLPILLDLALAPGKALFALFGLLVGAFASEGTAAEAGTVAVGASMQTMMTEVVAIMGEMLSVLGGIWAEIDGITFTSATRRTAAVRTAAAATTEATVAGMAATVEATTAGMTASTEVVVAGASTIVEVWTAAMRYLYDVTVVGMTGTATALEGGLAAIVGSTGGELVLYNAEFAAAQARNVAAVEEATVIEGTITRAGMANMAESAVVGGEAMRVGLLSRILSIPGAILGAFAAIPRLLFSLFAEIPSLIGAALSGLVPLLEGIGGAILAVLTSPFTIAIGIVVLAFALFRKQIEEGWNAVVNWFKSGASGIGEAFQPILNIIDAVVKGIVDAFNALPEGIKSALVAVVDMVEQAVMAVYKLFSYLNPWAHHSPSLVENVTTGMSAVVDQFSRLEDVAAPIAAAYQDIKRFGQAVSELTNHQNKIEISADISSIKKAGGGPAQVHAYNQDSADVAHLTVLQNALSDAMQNQQTIVDSLDASLKAENATLTAQNGVMAQLQATQQAAQEGMSTAQANLTKYTSMGITGEKALQDQIFATGMQQKDLQLQMMKIEDATGPIQNVQTKMQNLAGSMSALRGTAKSLRDAGASGDITGAYDTQITAMQSQYDIVRSQVLTYDALQLQLTNVQRKTQELQLQDSLTYDPLKKQISDAASALKEMSFADILAGTKAARESLNAYTLQYNAATLAVKEQAEVIKNLTAQRDALQVRYDRENAKLEGLKKAYQDVGQAITDVNKQLNSMVTASNAVNSAATKAAKAAKGPALSNVQKNFAAAAGGNFPSAILGKTDLGSSASGDIGAINKLTQQATDGLSKTLGKLNPFGSIKKYWNEFSGWWDTNVTPNLKIMWDSVFGGGGHGKGAAVSIFTSIADAIKTLIEWLHPVYTALSALWDLFKPQIMQFWNDLKSAFIQIGNDVGPKLLPFFKALWDLMVALWPTIKLVAEILGGILLLAIKVLADVFTNVLHPVLSYIISAFANLIQFLTGLIQFIQGVFTGNWSKIWEGIKNMFGAIWNQIINLISTAIQVIWNIIKGGLNGIYDFFRWLFTDVLKAVGDFISTVVDFFVALPKDILVAVSDIGKWLLSKGEDLVSGLLQGITVGSKLVLKFFLDLPGNVLGWIGDIGKWLILKGKELIGSFSAGGGGMLGGIFAGALMIHNFFADLPGNVITWIGNTAAWLINKGRDLIGSWDSYTGLLGGIHYDWNNLASWFGNLPSTIAGFFAGAGKWLFNAGKSVAQGLVDGVKWAMDQLAKILGTPVYWAVKYVVNPLITGLDLLPGVSIKTIDESSIPHYARGGVVPGDHQRDDVAAYLTPGEVVVPRHIVDQAGGAQSLMRALGFSGITGGPGAHYGGGGTPNPNIPGGIPGLGDLSGYFGGAAAGIAEQTAIDNSGISGVLSSIGGAISGLVDKVTHLLRAGAANVFDATVAGPLKRADNFLDHFGSFGTMLDHGIDSELDKITNWIRGKEVADQKKAAAISGVGGNSTDYERVIISQAQAMGLGSKGAEIGLMTALVESNMKNYANANIPESLALPHDAVGSDHYSAGLFQQQTGPFGTYWGTVAQVMNPAYSAHRFYQEMVGKVGNWRTMDPGTVAQDVQVSALPYAYSARQSEADSILQRLGANATITGANGRTIGYDSGGVLAPGITQAVNLSGKPEAVLTNDQWNRLSALASSFQSSSYSSNRMNATVPISGGPAVNPAPAVTYASNDKTTIVQIDKVVFPNIKSSADAKDLLDSLESLANGSR